MDYAVRRFDVRDGESNYQLVDASDIVLLVADQSMPPKEDGRRQIRLARPDGRMLATIDLPLVGEAGEDERRRDYAIIQDYAVYAIFSVYLPEDETANGPHVLIEVEGEKWAALPHPEEPSCYAIYDQIPAGLRSYDRTPLNELELPPDIGYICRPGEDLNYQVTLDPHRLEQTEFVALTLTFLLDAKAPPLREGAEA